MLQNWIQHLETVNLDLANKSTLLAVSGGVDSVAMCELFSQAGFDFSIAHVNFQLRGKDSDQDAAFVAKLAEKYYVPYYEKVVDTEAIAKKKKWSIQVAAREIRYEWLEEIRLENGMDYLATGHHAGDVTETVLYNLSRGCGIRGLHGILVQKEALIRPLLGAKKEDLLAYIKSQKLKHREDKSNASTKYSRNLIRLKVIPELQKINPRLHETFLENTQRFQDTEWLMEFALAELGRRFLEQTEDGFEIELLAVSTLPAAKTILYEWLLPHGFNGDQVAQMLGSLQTGSQYFSHSHQALIDRDKLKVQVLEEAAEALSPIQIHQDQELILFPEGSLSFTSVKKAEIVFDKDPFSACFDLKKFSFPLILRPWKEGDRFCPFGMKGKSKKLSDLFTDLKLDLLAKKKVFVLESDGKIAWVIGLRIDHRFRVNAKTTQALQVKFTK